MALNVPAGDGVFTYRFDPSLGVAESGRRVVVPIGRRTTTGVVIGPADEPPRTGVRDAVRLLDDGPLLTAEIVALARWAAAHYLSPLGPALKAALPAGIDVRDALSPRLTDAGRALLEQGQLDLPGQQSAVRRALRRAAAGARLSRKALLSLQQEGLVALVREEQPARVAEPLVEVAAAVAGASPDSLRKAPRQAELLAWLLARGGPVTPPVPVEELLVAFPKARPLLRALVKRRLATVERRPAGPAQAAPDAPWGAQSHTPTEAQAAA
ncbi:MAG TPA: hypothetical protein VLW85_06205, partial [Myxococcales bacterium]|nr:hypothetical protein [Myxococcales bacterium]